MIRLLTYCNSVFLYFSPIKEHQFLYKLTKVMILIFYIFGVYLMLVTSGRIPMTQRIRTGYDPDINQLRTACKHITTIKKTSFFSKLTKIMIPICLYFRCKFKVRQFQQNTNNIVIIKIPILKVHVQLLVLHGSKPWFYPVLKPVLYKLPKIMVIFFIFSVGQFRQNTNDIVVLVINLLLLTFDIIQTEKYCCKRSKPYILQLNICIKIATLNVHVPQNKYYPVLSWQK